MNDEDFRDFYEKYYRFSKRTALQIVRDESTADDITQDLFYNFYKMKDRLDLTNEKMLNSYVATSAANLAKDYLRKSYVKRELTAMETILMEEREDRRYNVEAELLCMEEREFLRMIFQRLRIESPTNYDIYVQVKILDVSPGIVAKEYGFTANNVNNRVLRTKRWLKEQLSNLYEE